MTDTQAFVARAINHMLDDAPWARQRLTPFSGQRFAVELGSCRSCFELAADGRLSAVEPDNRTPTEAVTIRLEPGRMPADALLGGDVNRLMQAVSLRGQAEMADALGFVFRNLRPDIEEALARRIGDIPAHRLRLTLEQLHRECSRAVHGTVNNLIEYATFEAGWLPDRPALAEFGTEVSRFRDDIARLEKRLDRLLD